MTKNVLPESSLEKIVLQTLDMDDTKILEKAPNLSPEDSSLFVYSVMG